MSLFQFVLILVFFNFLGNFILLFMSVNKKNPKPFLRFFFLPILFSAWLALIVQQINDIAYVSTRQVLGNLLLSLWVLKSFYLNKTLKLTLLSDFLTKFKNAVLKKELKRIILMIFFVSVLQIISFSPVVSLNFLSGPSSFYWMDFISLTICVFGISIYLKSINQQKSLEILPLKGLLEHSIHPEYFGNLLFFLGLFLLSVGATGGIWSLVGPLTILLLMHKVIIPENERRALSKVTIHNQ